MTINEIKKVVFIGGGTMGSFNAMVAAAAGYQVTVYDHSAEALAALPGRLQAWGQALIETWLTPREIIEAGLTRIQRTSDPVEAAADADLLSESVFERLDIKRQTHRQFDELCPPQTIMTTNTSTLLLSDIESAVRRGDKFAAMHFHQPSILADLVSGPRTSPKTVDLLQRYIISIGMTYVLLKKEKAGYLHNAMYSAFLGTGLMLKLYLGLDIEEIDRAWMLNQKTLAGPFGHMDHVGLNVIFDISEDQKNPDPPPLVSPEMVSEFFRPYIERGELGIKTGKGFYFYPDPAFAKPEFFEGKQENTLASNAMVNAVLATALGLVIDGVADIRDVDRSWMITHRPEIGPFGMIDEKGLDVFLRELEEGAAISEVLAASLPALSDYLKRYIDKGALGVKTGKGFYTYPDPEFKKPDYLMLAGIPIIGS